MTSSQPAPRISLFHGSSSVSPDLLAFFLVFLVTVVTYLGLASHSFVDYDDLRIIVNRIDTYDGLNLDNLLAIIVRDHPREEPLIVRDISYLINAELFGPLNPLGYLAGNLLLHILASFLTYRLFLSLFPARYWTAMFTAILFALHPIHVESVAWISSRKDTLYACFFLAAFLSYQRFLCTSKRMPLLCSYLLFVFSLFSKSAAIAFFPLVVSYRLLLGSSTQQGKSAELLYLAATALSTLLFVIWYHWELATFGVFVNHGAPLLKHAPGQWLLLNAEVITFYLIKLCFPVNLAIIYNEPTLLKLFQNPTLLGASMAVATAMAFMAMALWRRPDKRPLFLLGWFIITLAPYLNLAGVNIYVADRYCYLSSLALLAAAAIALSALHKRCLAIRSPLGLSLSYSLIAIAIMLCAAMSTVSIDTIKVWESTETLWTNALRVAPLRLTPHAALAKTLLATFEANPNSHEARSSLQGAKRVASAAYTRYCKNGTCPPAMTSVLTVLGKINYYEGNLTEAERYIKNILDFDAKNLSALHVYSYILAGQGHYDDAEHLARDIEHAADPKKNKKMLADIHDQLRPLLAAKQKAPQPAATKQDF